MLLCLRCISYLATKGGQLKVGHHDEGRVGGPPDSTRKKKQRAHHLFHLIH